jgi:XRE family transcriptional regulator, regulator of sulfur utilization
MVSRRDFGLVLASVCLTSMGFSLASPDPPELLGASVFDWAAMTAGKTDVGEYRQVIRAPTATLDELELHVTTLMPGLSSHPPHRHVNEELVIVREGTVEVFSNDEWKRLTPGSVVFNSTNSLHAIRNVGDKPAVYHVINWQTPATKSLARQQPDAKEG